MHSLHNYVEGVRRRVKNLEDLEGASNCVAAVKQLQVDRTAEQGGNTQQTLTMLTQKTITAQNPVLETIPEEPWETEEEILTR